MEARDEARDEVTRLAYFCALIGLGGCFSLARTQPLQEHFVLGAGAFLPDAQPPAVSFDVTVGVRRLKLASYRLATWEISRPPDGSPLAWGSTDYRHQGWRVADCPGLVTLLAEGLGVVADDLAAALAGLPPVMDDPRVR